MTTTNSSNPDFLISSIKCKSGEKVEEFKGIIKISSNNFEIKIKDENDEDQMTPVIKLASSW